MTEIIICPVHNIAYVARPCPACLVGECHDDLLRMLKIANDRLDGICQTIDARNGLHDEIAEVIAKAEGKR